MSDDVNPELPLSIVRRIVKAQLNQYVTKNGGKEFQVSKDAQQAFSICAKVFCSFIASTANDVCREHKRRTVGADDVYTALTQVNFEDISDAVRSVIEEHTEYQKAKKVKKSSDSHLSKKRKLPEVEGAVESDGQVHEVEDDDAEADEKVDDEDAQEVTDDDDGSDSGKGKGNTESEQDDGTDGE
uniref:Transcription factor CBF/NF-Y/archaeal histone domain-containing protein n=1 Tax=Polytomella parva TaxID=51329 RepID=A0A7S0UQT5_9CHLO|mmetsp:Transcript_17950/g.32777  ORF Transcript_17950/g.32777 Transcript_17950/m.32777 type:complete len:185 (+) Transcript_17950:168-722(+)|eukprot:CAMPEP_0175045844 /NCGR_PEP_ID=MMETSP0052_2-20121109/4681_1 /TAXON_ID=51329 ORGANISM="Polytomella parva, Strain SAG 63-3" /NCGR_SAMPLE_ID=MMETSP0052_2 /ASSEMBLY_ACC=CAM_ASM_000194 /LENGTH=184 /DNA_ID=CAMNT_0016309485 /DNA_START=28 /DNA_END=582 /DNA_ORIENTATION=-